MDFQRGDILEATNRAVDAGYHYIIFYEGLNDQNFIGGMLTGSSMRGNISFVGLHFEVTNQSGVQWSIPSKKSYLVKAKLMKLHTWGPFRQVGKLTEEGCTLMYNTINDLQSETWDEYLNRTKAT